MCMQGVTHAIPLGLFPEKYPLSSSPLKLIGRGGSLPCSRALRLSSYLALRLSASSESFSRFNTNLTKVATLGRVRLITIENKEI